jgi:hypothetical protein
VTAKIDCEDLDDSVRVALRSFGSGRIELIIDSSGAGYFGQGVPGLKVLAVNDNPKIWLH